MKKCFFLLIGCLLFTACASVKKEVPSRQVFSTDSSLSVRERIEMTEERVTMVYPAGSLLKAVVENQLEEVQAILKSSYETIDEQNNQGESPLLIATHQNQIAIAKALIDAGADVNLQDDIQDSPYLYAGAQGKTDILAYMLEHATPDQQVVNRYGGNALIPAAEKGHLANVKLLLADGHVAIDHQNNFGYTALIEAVALRDGSQVYLEIVQELLKYKADKTLRDNSGRTAEDYAEALGYTEILKALQN